MRSEPPWGIVRCTNSQMFASSGTEVFLKSLRDELLVAVEA